MNKKCGVLMNLKCGILIQWNIIQQWKWASYNYTQFDESHKHAVIRTRKQF